MIVDYLSGSSAVAPNQQTKWIRRLIKGSTILSIASMHFVAGIFTLLFSFGASMSRFDSPSPAPFSFSERVMGALTTVLHFPVVTYWPFPAPGLMGYLVFGLNSLLWALCIYAVGIFFLRRARRASAA